MKTLKGKNEFWFEESIIPINKTNSCHLNNEQINKLQNIITYRKNIAQNYKAKYKIFLTPRKFRIYPEMLPFDFDQSSKNFIDEFIENFSDCVYYPKELMLLNKNFYNIYQTRDHHWTEYGTYICMNEFIKIFNVNFQINPSSISILYNMGGQQCNLFSEYKNTNTKVKISYLNTTSLIFSCFLFPIEIKIYINENKSLPKACFFANSFMISQPYSDIISQYFSKLIIVRGSVEFFPYFLGKEKFDLIVQQLWEDEIFKLVNNKCENDYLNYFEELIYLNSFKFEDLKVFINSIIYEKDNPFDAQFQNKITYIYHNYVDSLKDKGIDEQFQAVLDKNKKLVRNISLFNIGSIVMNLNPMTNGHKYLIEFSKEKVDILIIFIVQEDKSRFKFIDRILLAIKATLNYKNVIILPSSNFIISQMTFKEYFEKDKKYDLKIDASKDLSFFKYIASSFNIKKRFIGQEPFDNITKQYNEQMHHFLTSYGIEVIEIPRCKDLFENPISASYIRKLIDKNDYETIKALVPDETFTFLTKENNNTNCTPIGFNEDYLQYFYRLYRNLKSENKVNESNTILSYIEKVTVTLQLIDDFISILKNNNDIYNNELFIRNLIQKDIKTVYLYTQLSLINEKNAEDKEAIENIKKALEISPHDLKVKSRLISLMIKIKDYEGAFSEIKKAIQENPLWAEGYKQYSLIYDVLGNIDSALEYAHKAREIDPNDFSLQSHFIKILYKKKDYSRCLSAVHNSLALKPLWSEGYRLLALAHEARGEIDMAIAAELMGIAITPLDFPWGRVHLVSLMLSIKNIDGAEKAVQELLMYHPDWAISYRQLALVCEAKDQINEAIAAAQKAFELDPQGPYVKSTLDRIVKKFS